MTLQHTSVERKRRERKSRPKPTQLDLPLDLAGALAASIAQFEVPPEGAIQSARAVEVTEMVAAEVTEMVAVAHEAMRDLERKTRKRVKS